MWQEEHSFSHGPTNTAHDSMIIHVVTQSE